MSKELEQWLSKIKLIRKSKSDDIKTIEYILSIKAEAAQIICIDALTKQYEDLIKISSNFRKMQLYSVYDFATFQKYEKPQSLIIRKKNKNK